MKPITTEKTKVKLNCTLVELARILKTTPEKLMNIKITTLEQLLEKYGEMERAADDYNRLAQSLGLYD